MDYTDLLVVVRPRVDSMLFPVQRTYILETAYYLPVFNILIRNSSDEEHCSLISLLE